MNVKSTVYTLYEIFTKSITGDDHKWVPSEDDSKCVDRFISMWENRGVQEGSLGIRFLYDYFCDSYNMWTNRGESIEMIPLNRIIGKPQLKRWSNRHEEYQYLYRVQFLSKVKIPRLSDIIKEINKDKSPKEVNIAEEYERQRFYNTPNGLMNCIITTSLCDPESKFCGDCNNRSDCIEEIKIRDKSTALKRGFIKLQNEKR